LFYILFLLVAATLAVFLPSISAVYGSQAGTPIIGFTLAVVIVFAFVAIARMSTALTDLRFSWYHWMLLALLLGGLVMGCVISAAFTDEDERDVRKAKFERHVLGLNFLLFVVLLLMVGVLLATFQMSESHAHRKWVEEKFFSGRPLVAY
jgi:hypothetical protein